MKRILALTFLLAGVACGGDRVDKVDKVERADLTLTDGTVYRGYKVLRQEGNGLMVEYADGIVRVPRGKLPEEVQKKYKWLEAVERYHADIAESKAAAAREKESALRVLKDSEKGDFAMTLVEAEEAIIDAGYSSQPHVYEDSCWLTGEKTGGGMKLDLVIFQRLGVDVPMIERKASRVTVTANMNGVEPLRTAALAAPAVAMFRAFGGDGKALKKWIGEQAQTGRGVQRYECELSGCHVFMALNDGFMLMVEFTRLAE